MLSILPENLVYFFGSETDYSIDFNRIDDSSLSPAPQSLDRYTEEFGRLTGGEKFLLDVHLISFKSP